jgi:hypothetical protein
MPTTATPALPLDFLHALAAQLRARSPEARLLFRLVKLHRHLAAQADGPDGALADGLRTALTPAIAAAAERFRAGPLA